MRILGILLIVVGGAALAFEGISYTRREKVIDIGPIEAAVERDERVSIPPLVGFVALAAGAILLYAGHGWSKR